MSNNCRIVSWCFSCGTAEKTVCGPSGHSLVQMTADTIRNLDALLKLKEDVLKMKDERHDKLVRALKKRKQIQEKLSLISKSIKAAGDEVKKLEDENKICLNELVAMLMLKQMNNSSPNQRDMSLSELMEMVDGSSPEDTAETLREKMMKSVELAEHQLTDATAVASDHDNREKIKISLQLYDDKNRRIPTCKWLEGFCFQPVVSPPLMGTQIRQDLMLISYLVTSFMRKQNCSLEMLSANTPKPSELLQATSVSLSTNNNNETMAASILASLPALDLLFPSKFVLGQSSVFILRLFQSGHLQTEIHIRPVPTFHPEFVQKLGEFCYKSPKPFSNGVDKVYI